MSELRLVGAAETNKVMAGELLRLVKRGLGGVRLPAPRKEGTGQLLYPFTPELAYLAVCYHRTSSRILWDLYSSRAARLEPLYADLFLQVEAESRNWWWEGARISVTARNVGAFAAGERQVVGTVKNALLDGARKRGITLEVDPDRPEINMAVRLHDDRLSVSIDLAGGPRNKRGYRAEGGLAPLRENLAAALVMLARFDARSEILFDPMGGSGTIAIEAALMARAEPIWGADPPPALLRLPLFHGFSDRRAHPLFADTRPAVVYNEIDPEIHDAAKVNMRAAGVSEDIRAVRGDFRSLTPEQVTGGMRFERGLILSNPPYGERIGGGEVVTLYRDLGEWLRRFSGWRAAFLVAHPRFEETLRMRPRIKKPLSSKPFRGYFYLYDL